MAPPTPPQGPRRSARIRASATASASVPSTAPATTPVRRSSRRPQPASASAPAPAVARPSRRNQSQQQQGQWTVAEISEATRQKGVVENAIGKPKHKRNKLQTELHRIDHVVFRGHGVYVEGKKNWKEEWDPEWMELLKKSLASGVLKTLRWSPPTTYHPSGGQPGSGPPPPPPPSAGAGAPIAA